MPNLMERKKKKRRSRYPRGQCGLANLTNTCYMSSAVQCLSNIPPLREFFLSGKYLEDVNEVNPIGYKGILATTFGEMLKEMWSGNQQSVTPLRFKLVVGKVDPRFAGNGQQDAHELMTSVLDGIHEDLNRVKKKPYFEHNDEIAKLPDSLHAQKAWELHKQRDDSIIVDQFHGQLKSSLNCPDCGHISIKFDPFLCLSLPLPPKKQTSNKTVVLLFKEQPWRKILLEVFETTTMADAKHAMMKEIDAEKKRHFVFYTQANEFKTAIQIMMPEDLISQEQTTIFGVEVDDDLRAKGTKLLAVFNRTNEVSCCTLPMFFTLPSNAPVTQTFLLTHVLDQIKKFFLTPKAIEKLKLAENDLRQLFDIEKRIEGRSVSIDYTRDVMEFPEGSEGADIYDNCLAVAFRWNKLKRLVNNRGEDLRTINMSTECPESVDLLHTVDLFTQKEQLGATDSWRCQNCKKHVRAFKRLELWKLPDILILHLKRFQYTEWSREKLKSNVTIPVRGLDLTDKVANPSGEKQVYDLIAYTSHFGTLVTGHYMATAYNDKTRKWLEFNDSYCKEIPDLSETVISSKPYCLVYKRSPQPNSETPSTSSNQAGN